MLRAVESLFHDHQSLDGVLAELLDDLRRRDVHESYRQLDLFWARLAMHIRAEHLHLFPALLAAVRDDGDSFGSEVKTVIDDLRRDHEFFMRELAAAIATVRELSLSTNQTVIDEQLRNVYGRVAAVEQRLQIHNEVEEEKVYLWADSLLNHDSKRDLASRMDGELANYPKRLQQ